MDDVKLYERYTVTKENLDTSALDEALALVPKEEESYYTEESWNAYQDAVLAAKLEKVNADATQDTVNKAAETLKKAYEALAKKSEKPVVDKKGLQELYDLHKDDVQGNFTDKTWEDFRNALKNAETVLGDETADQDKIEQAKKLLEDAIAALEEKTEGKADKAALEKLFNAHKDDKQGNFTDKTWKDFQDALKNADAVLKDDTADQKKVDKAKENLEAAIAALKENPKSETDKSALGKLYNAHKNDKQNNYTDETWRIFADALKNAETILNDDSATQEEINKAASDLSAALSGLKEKGADKSALQKLYDKHKDDKQGSYTGASWKQFQKALETAASVLEDDKASQSEVNKAKDSLEKAIKNLKKKTGTPGTTKKKPSSTSGTKTAKSAKTGDESPLALLAGLLVLSGGTAVILGKKRKYQK
ncbi:sortase B protein-sorting domain-containing protein [Blautia marasmi]|uniref:sortase B protein-sorting domain-containing protein n=1 Tax=Blautia marasmi TaxID=1917868 RepID=UPI002E8E296A|nr:sortase B protein-sorting domain-containing protein [Blautia marasmi]